MCVPCACVSYGDQKTSMESFQSSFSTYPVYCVDLLARNTRNSNSLAMYYTFMLYLIGFEHLTKSLRAMVLS